MFRLKQKVKIISSQKMDGRFNFGTVVGAVIQQNGSYLGYKNEREFMARFDGSRVKYTVAYIDCVTGSATVEEFTQSELEKK